MRLLVIALVCVVLSGCSGVYMPNFTISKDVEPFPADYPDVVRAQLLRVGEIGAFASRPQKMNSWSIYEPAGWSICVRRHGLPDQAYAIIHGNITGALEATGLLCAEANYVAIDS